ncbi:hypothetical protein JZ751_021865 [Albula glossodonta]|uniref:ADP-ribosylation factor-like 13A n=1 Tax=Albula glossodonta TaxID=121402 RepID=A0A8T2NJG1_9TELE|nr:hypothetical protein JZ751_008401 [Albula glossodonta]KAG9340144.1 hypothetical protein JZ751_021865 [Albula glossodonta]
MLNLMTSCCGWIYKSQEPIRPVTVLIVGLENAGKTSAVRGILKVPLEEKGSPERCACTELRVENFLVSILDISGSSTASGAWRDYCGMAHGIIFVVDSSNRTQTREAKDFVVDLLKHPRVAGKPLLVLANKQDKVDAMLCSELIDALSLEKLISQSQSLCHVEPCSALLDARRWSDRRTLHGLRWLLRAVRLDYHELCARIAHDGSQPMSHEEREKGRHKVAERGQSKANEAKVSRKTQRERIRPPKRMEKKTLRSKSGEKMQPLRNILNKESTLKSKLKKKKQQGKIKEKVKKRSDRKEKEGEEGEVEPDQNVQKEEGHSTALLPGNHTRPKHKPKKKKETLRESPENSKASKGKEEKEKKKRMVKMNKKNKIKSAEVPVEYSQPVDLSDTFDLYRKTVLALNAKREQDNEARAGM